MERLCKIWLGIFIYFLLASPLHQTHNNNNNNKTGPGRFTRAKLLQCEPALNLLRPLSNSE